jgi:hypothetical protein
VSDSWSQSSDYLHIFNNTFALHIIIIVCMDFFLFVLTYDEDLAREVETSLLITARFSKLYLNLVLTILLYTGLYVSYLATNSLEQSLPEANIVQLVRIIAFYLTHHFDQ